MKGMVIYFGRETFHQTTEIIRSKRLSHCTGFPWLNHPGLRTTISLSATDPFCSIGGIKGDDNSSTVEPIRLQEGGVLQY